MKYIIKVHGIKSGYRGYLSTRLLALKHKNFKTVIRSFLKFDGGVTNKRVIFAKKFKSFKSAERRKKHLEKLHKGYLEFEILEAENDG